MLSRCPTFPSNFLLSFCRFWPICPSLAPGLHLGPSSDLTPTPWSPRQLILLWDLHLVVLLGGRGPGSKISPAVTSLCGIKRITSPFQASVPFAK